MSDEDKFKADAVFKIFNLAYVGISSERKTVVGRGLKVPDKGTCGKCKHPRVNKGYLNLHEEFCCDKLYANFKKHLKAQDYLQVKQ